MTCLRPDVIDLCLGGELEAAERRECEAHLDACPACRRMLADRRALDQAVAALPSIEIPPDFAARVMGRLPAAEPGAARAWGWLASAAAGAGLLLAGFLGVYLATGQSLMGVLMSLGRALMAFLSLVVPLLAKVLKIVPVFARLAWEIAGALLRGLGVFSSSLRPEAQGFILAAGFALVVLTIFGLKTIESLGRKP
jgi:predicted anti-sigma-YlaC factor YlaD